MSSVARFVLAAATVAALAPAFASVDANTASPAQLESVAGIGPAIAARIVEERRKAPFANAQELAARVRGVGEASVRRMLAGGLTVGAAPPPRGIAPAPPPPPPEIIIGYPAQPAAAATARRAHR